MHARTGTLALICLALLAAPSAAQEPELLPDLPARTPATRKASRRQAAPALPRAKANVTGQRAKAHTPAAQAGKISPKGRIPAAPGGVGPGPANELGILADDWPSRMRTAEGSGAKGLREGLRGTKTENAPSQPSYHGRGPSDLSAELSGEDSDALDRLLARLGGARAFFAMKKVTLKRKIEAFDGRGEGLFEHRFEQEAVLDRALRADAIQWTKDLSYGHKGGRPWARSAGVDRPDLETRAGAEAEFWGLLLRFPFGLRDRSRYIVQAEERVIVLGTAYKRIRVLEREERPGVGYGPHAVDRKRRDSGCDIYLDPLSGLPILLEIRKKGGRKRRVLFEDYRKVGTQGLKLPFGRTLLAENGESPSLRIRWERLEQD